jgi:glutamyl-tRNA synthetase
MKGDTIQEGVPSASAHEAILSEVFSEKLSGPAHFEEKYPPRTLPEGAMVTRIAPSPTGFMHIGTIYTALISERFAHQTHGVFFLRIEDTDKKREVPGASALIVKTLYEYAIVFDEGRDLSGVDKGAYGPYLQSDRVDLYRAHVKALFEKGMAYVCFCTTEELEAMRKQQESQGVRPGYYGQWAVWRDASEEEVLKKLKNGAPYVIRFRSPGDFNRKVIVEDEILGRRELPENDQDIVLMKVDGLPTYHLAHVVDDHYMRTTHVIRGDEWFSSLPLHMQLFEAFGWTPPHFAHIAPIQRLDGSSRRKLSKRKDPEANAAYFDQEGYPRAAVIEYLLNLANSNFEDWRMQNPEKDYRDFSVSFLKLKNSNGALFDFVKLNDVSAGIIARFTAAEVYDRVLAWAKEYNAEFAMLLARHAEYAKKIFSIERENAKNPRKDFRKWSDVPRETGYFFDEWFSPLRDEITRLLADFPSDDVRQIVNDFMPSYDESASRDEWFDTLKAIAKKHAYAESIKEFKANPGAYKGNIGDVAKIFRILLSGRPHTPDLYSVMQVMGKDRVFERLRHGIA